MRFPTVTFVYDRYKKASAVKKATVEIRLSHNYKQKYISTGVMIYPNQWKNNTVVNAPDSVQLNQVLDNMLIEIKQILLDMQKKGNIDIMHVGEELKKKNESYISFIEFCAKRAEIRKYGKSLVRQKRYNLVITVIKQWGLIRNFEDVTEGNLILFDRYLKEKGLRAYTKWHNYHQFLNTFINDAIQAGYLKRNPYSFINIERAREAARIDKYLSKEEFKRVKRVKLPTKSLEKVRDLFVFQTYTLLSYSDLKDFDASKIKYIKKIPTYINIRHKTNHPFTVPLLPQALAILTKYGNSLPIISNVKYNVYLKAVAQFAKIDKPLTSHWARHTGATLLLNEGVPMQVVSRICGHSSTKITEQIYAKLLDETVVNAVSGIKLL